jgi:hypothetical protein
MRSAKCFNQAMCKYLRKGLVQILHSLSLLVGFLKIWLAFKILAETKMAKQALADVEARHKDIMKLERDIIELQEMFVDFAAMIEDQVGVSRSLDL